MASEGVVELLQKLVALPSVNPEHTDQPDMANEFRVADFFAEYMSRLGCGIEWDRFSPERASVIASYGPAEPAHTLLLEAHLDTVGVADMTIPPFEPTIRNGRLYGRGSCDTKGPMAAAMTALTPSVLDRLAEAGIRLLYVGAFGEEKGNLGAERLVEQGLGADAAIILEPTDLSIVYAHKGALWFDIILTGEAAHGSDPARGRNAIMAMASVLKWLETRIQQDQAAFAHPALGGPTLNVGRIHGGVAMNIVAHRCRIEVDRRTLPGEDNDRILSEVRTYLSELKGQGDIHGYEVNILKTGTPFETDQQSALVRDFRQAIRDAGHADRLTTAAWYSDAGAFSHTCKDVIVFGPGSIYQAHTVDEYMEVDELLKGQAILSTYFAWLARDLTVTGGTQGVQ